MSYQVLARKWRPKQFDTLAGQAHVLRALQHALDQNRLHHAYLFTGTRGVGKTTIARIFAKALNCDRGISSTPCGECDSCRDIDAGRMIDLLEIDAASRTKVEDTRELLDNVQYAPARARFKIYIIDEVHMLSTHSFNALLKTLEEPPAHVKFLLATTDPQKLPVTVLSRCLQFHLKNLPVQQIHDYLQHVLTEEKIPFEKPALLQIARSAEGSMRDALSLLDQAISFCDGTINQYDVSQMLGTISAEHIQTLLTHIQESNGQKLLSHIQGLAEYNSDFNLLLQELISVFHQIALAQTIPQALREDGVLSAETIREFATRFSKEDVQLYYQIALLGRKDLPLATDARSGIEMTLLRMLAFRPAHLDIKKIQAKPQIVTPTPPVKNASLPPAPITKTSTDWTEITNHLVLSGTTKLLASHCSLKKMDEAQIELILSPQYDALLNDRIQERLASALEAYFNKKIKLLITLDQSSHQTPHEQATQEKAQKQDTLINTLNQDNELKNLMDTFNVSLKPDMIKNHCNSNFEKN